MPSLKWFWRLRPSDIDVRLLAYTHQLLKGLEEETGIDPGYIVNGGLFVASSKVKFIIIFHCIFLQMKINGASN